MRAWGCGVGPLSLSMHWGKIRSPKYRGCSLNLRGNQTMSTTNVVLNPGSQTSLQLPLELSRSSKPLVSFLNLLSVLFLLLIERSAFPEAPHVVTALLFSLTGWAPWYSRKLFLPIVLSSLKSCQQTQLPDTHPFYSHQKC